MFQIASVRLTSEAIHDDHASAQRCNVLDLGGLHASSRRQGARRHSQLDVPCTVCELVGRPDAQPNRYGLIIFSNLLMIR